MKMKKIRKIALLGCMLASFTSCSVYQMQGNPAAVQAGASIGGVLGAIIGDRAGGYTGSQFGALLGTVAGAAVGNAVTTPREDTYETDEYAIHTRPSSPRYDPRREDDDHRYGWDDRAPVSDLQIVNLRFIDDNRNRVIDAEEECKLIFDIVNAGDTPAYNVTPVVEEQSGMKHLSVSAAVQIAYMPVGNRIRYTAIIQGGKKLKTGQAVFQVYAIESDGAVTRMHEFTLPTQKRIRK